MKITERNLRELLAMHERRAQALREILEDATGQQRESKRQTSAAVLQKAIALDTARRSGSRAPKRQQSKRSRFTKLRSIEGRTATRAWLNQFDRTEPRKFPLGVDGAPERIGPYIMNGYLKKKGGGYVRTAKEFPLAVSRRSQQESTT